MTRRHTFLSLAVLACLFVLPAAAQTPSETPPRTISVSGESTVRVAPDRAIVRFGVVTQAEDPEAARAQNAEAASQAMNAVRDLGIDEDAMRLEMLRLQPAREYNSQTQRHEERGFEAARQVVVELDSLDLLPTLVARVVQQGANRLESIQYDLQNRDAPRNEALQEALLNAREKARLMTRALDVQLGPVLTISEQRFDFPRPLMRLEAQAMARDMAEPEPDAYAPGVIEVQAEVQVVFELE